MVSCQAFKPPATIAEFRSIGKHVNKSIGIGRKVVVSCSLEISRKVFSTRGGLVR